MCAQQTVPIGPCQRIVIRTGRCLLTDGLCCGDDGFLQLGKARQGGLGRVGIDERDLVRAGGQDLQCRIDGVVQALPVLLVLHRLGQCCNGTAGSVVVSEFGHRKHLAGEPAVLAPVILLAQFTMGSDDVGQDGSSLD